MEYVLLFGMLAALVLGWVFYQVSETQRQMGLDRAARRLGMNFNFGLPRELRDAIGRFRCIEKAKEAEMAKQAYEQLNEQLFTELPQLIDLRVPYLDPSFEALVKIQLRFCAEAYSRMAQVQQYLDADTRDQYAQGNLDNRVEQVLQEIRDLSIAGTV